MATYIIKNAELFNKLTNTSLFETGQIVTINGDTEHAHNTCAIITENGDEFITDSSAIMYAEFHDWIVNRGVITANENFAARKASKEAEQRAEERRFESYLINEWLPKNYDAATQRHLSDSEIRSLAKRDYQKKIEAEEFRRAMI